MNNLLEVKNLYKTYHGGKTACKDVSLNIEKGEIFGFIGHNGAGKTTTIKCIVGLLRYDSGEIIFDGEKINQNDIEYKGQIAYIPDNPDLYDYLSGIQYLNFIADICKIDQESRVETITKYAKLFEIADSLGNLVSTYSHGMKQKLALISALIRKPKLLVLDEPFVGLDPKAAYDVKEIMRSMCEEGASIFFSTHVLEVAEKLCDKIAIIKNGEIVANGTVDEVKGDSSLEDVFLELANHE